MKNPKIKEVNIYEASYKFPDGGIAEMIYEPDKEQTSFLVRKDGKIEPKSEYLLAKEYDPEKEEIKLVMLRPLPPYNGMIKTEFIKLPSGIAEYKTEQELFGQIKKYIDTYVVLPEDFSTVAAVYIMMSWLYDKFQVLPYLRVIGMYGTGKSRFLSVVGSVCYKPMMAGGSATPASLFRTVDQIKGTFVLDEADFRTSEMWSEIVKILNSGQSKGSPVVRMESRKDTFITKTFHVYGPKILASREPFSDKALESRCLTQIMFPQEKVSSPVHLPEKFEADALHLRNQLLAFRFKFYGLISANEETLPKIKDNRLKQSALALTTIASIIGQDVLKQIKKFLKIYETNLDYDDISDPKCDVIEAILKLLEMRETKYDRLRINDIAGLFKTYFQEDYTERITEGTTDKGSSRSTTYGISPRKIGSYIKQLNIRTMRDGKGYYISIRQEYEKIKCLAHKYGFDKRIKLPDIFSPGSIENIEEEDGEEKIVWPEEGLDKKDDTEKVEKESNESITDSAKII